MAPTGTVTFLFTDVEGSTRLWAEDRDAMSASLRLHDAVLNDVIAQHGGYVFSTAGDSFAVAFARASDGVRAAEEAQTRLGTTDWPGPVIRVRMGLHVGEADERDGDYFGPAVNIAARVEAAGHGGQVLLTDAVRSTANLRSVRDLGVHRLRDVNDPLRLFQYGDVPFPALRSSDRARSNLPLQLTPLVGRHGEVAAVGSLLRECRLVTLMGAGGVGKTRLGLATAAEVSERYLGGVWFADLAVVSDPATVASALLAACGTSEAPGRTTVETLVQHLGQEQTLLVLDNCEHVLTAVAPMAATLLSSCPTLSLLATSREPLAVEGEVTWLVPPLAVPEIDSPADPAALETFDAVRLFVLSAARARPGMRLNAANAIAVAQICRRLDGIPFALELAAARCRQLDPVRIAAELDDRFRLLTGGTQTSLAHHRTLAASVDWSHERLEPHERVVLRRMGVFAGPFPLAAAEAVAAASGDLSPTEVLDAILRLVDRSLVHVEERAGDTVYRLLETVRHYALARATEAGELDAVRDAHADWWTTWLEDIGADDVNDTNVTQVRTFYDNCRAALEWRVGDPAALRLVRCLWSTWMGFRSEDASTLAARAEQAAPAGSLERSAIAMFRFFAICVAGGTPPAEIVADMERVIAQGTGDDHAQAVRMRWNLLHGVDPLEIPTVTPVVRASHHHWTREAFEGTASIVQLFLGDAADGLDRLARVDPSGLAACEVLVNHARNMRWVVTGELPPPPGVHRHLESDGTLVDPMTNAIMAQGTAQVGLLRGDRRAVDGAVVFLRRLAARTPLVDPFLGCATALARLAACKSAALPSPSELFTAVRAIQMEQAIVLALAALSNGQTGEARAFIALIDSPVDDCYMMTARTLYEGVVAMVEHDPDTAARCWFGALATAAERGYALLAVDALSGIAHLMARDHHHREALRLTGASERLREDIGYRFRLTPTAAWLDEARQEAAALLDAAEARAALEEGRDQPWQDAATWAVRSLG